MLHLHVHSLYIQVLAEGIPQLFRCAVIVTGILLAPQWGLAIFCLGQVTDHCML